MQVAKNGMTMSLAYEEHGAGPAVLLLHGYPSHCHDWAPQIQSLVLAGYRVIVPDLQAGPAAPGDRGFELQGEELIRLLNYLGIGRAAVVELAPGTDLLEALQRRYPQRLAAVVSLDAFPVAGGKVGSRVLVDFFRGVSRHPRRSQPFARVA